MGLSRCPTTFVVIIACSVIFLMNVMVISGISTCKNTAIYSIISNSCKFKRSHLESRRLGQSYINNDETEIEGDEVLEILTNGIALMRELSQDLKAISGMQSLRKKKETDDGLFEFGTNDLPGSVEAFFPEEDALVSIFSTGSQAEGVKLWKKLMRAAVRRGGGKFRRDVASAVYKCCSHAGCNESDFSHLC